MGRAVLDIQLLLEQLGRGDLVSDAGFLGILFKIVLRHHGRCLTDYFFHRFSNFDYSIINKRLGLFDENLSFFGKRFITGNSRKYTRQYI
jgi:hypothetical protein